MPTYLSLVIDRKTGREVEEYQHDASSEKWAIRKAMKAFKDQAQYTSTLRKIDDWYIETIEI